MAQKPLCCMKLLVCVVVVFFFVLMMQAIEYLDEFQIIISVTWMLSAMEQTRKEKLPIVLMMMLLLLLASWLSLNEAFWCAKMVDKLEYENLTKLVGFQKHKLSIGIQARRIKLKFSMSFHV